ncbi:hypothetical protein jhhlp_000164 [Lomentospora prolificans]|uniref:Heterokaryon incompatibility domain-containing protein n=1 Tax=Lomentospora prolificans TaxID=41688 RepID=A0A2N3NLS7_9PEZI|nr:hypothetical protein jhhlp_000164 [Lomentospora prolificans]
MNGSAAYLSSSRRQREIETIKQWMALCASQHEANNCNTRRSKIQPERLIDLSTEHGGPRLVPASSLDPSVEFAALSYRWGSAENLKTTLENLSQMQEHIPCDSLPPTHRDAFELVKSIGFRYLWIDALCIIQDNGADKHREILKMGSVYSNATLVIAAMTSKSTEKGLFSTATNSLPLADDNFHDVMRACRTMPRKHWESIISETLPLLCRGWAFQERLLARRIIHFTDAELVWECKGEIWCECGNIMKVGHLKRGINNLNAAFDLSAKSPAPERVRPMWRECVKTFSRRDLTDRKDRVFAIRGVAELLRPNCEDLYISGLWKDALPYDLLWRCDQSTVLGEKKSCHGPSWSWESVDCGINWPSRHNDRWKGSLPIPCDSYFERGLSGPIDCAHAEMKENCPDKSPISPGHIHLDTRIMEITIRKNTHTSLDISLLETDWHVEMTGGRRLPFYPDIQLTGEACFYYVEVVAPPTNEVGWQAGLIVRELSPSKLDGMHWYERVGVAGEMSFDPTQFTSSFVPESPSRRVILA